MNNYFCTSNGCVPCPPSVRPCGDSFRLALELLCSPQLAPAVNFQGFAFVSDFYILGAGLGAVSGGSTPSDNLGPLHGSCTWDGSCLQAVTVSGPLYPPLAEAAPVTDRLHQAALDSLRAVVLEASREAREDSNPFETLLRALSQQTGALRTPDCAALRSATVAAGPLLVENGLILGRLGGLLLLANPMEQRFYLICAEKIDFMG